jgi:hypothetical protein
MREVSTPSEEAVRLHIIIPEASMKVLFIVAALLLGTTGVALACPEGYYPCGEGDALCCPE